MVSVDFKALFALSRVSGFGVPGSVFRMRGTGG